MVFKMVSQGVKAKCLMWLHESRHVVTVQRRLCPVGGKHLPTKVLICKGYKLFDQTGYIHKGKIP
jgi:hypothetical protein